MLVSFIVLLDHLSVLILETVLMLSPYLVDLEFHRSQTHRELVFFDTIGDLDAKEKVVEALDPVNEFVVEVVKRLTNETPK